jgi:hypothetical protein
MSWTIGWNKHKDGSIWNMAHNLVPLKFLKNKT